MPRPVVGVNGRRSFHFLKADWLLRTQSPNTLTNGQGFERPGTMTPNETHALPRHIMSDWLEEGSKAPAFTLQADDGSKIKLADLKESPIVLYFYPADDTPGCTKEACAFRDRSAELAKLGAKVFGVSPDDVASHVKFRDKFKLNFPLLADPDHAVAEKFGAWREKNMYGKKSMGIARSTYLIGKDGVIKKVWKAVKVEGHDAAVIEALKELATE